MAEHLARSHFGSSSLFFRRALSTAALFASRSSFAVPADCWLFSPPTNSSSSASQLTQSCAVEMIAYPQEVIEWILSQTSSGGYSVREWHEWYSQYDLVAWSEYYASHCSPGGVTYQAEQWHEYMLSPSWKVGHPGIGTLMELGEGEMVHILQASRRVTYKSDVRRRTQHKFSPY